MVVGAQRPRESVKSFRRAGAQTALSFAESGS